MSFITPEMFAARARRTTRGARVLPISLASWKSFIQIIATSTIKSGFKSCVILVCYCTSSAVAGVCRSVSQPGGWSWCIRLLPEFRFGLTDLKMWQLIAF